MRILFAIKNLAHAGGGAERVLVEIASGLVERGHDIAVLTFDAPGRAYFYRLDERVRRIELPVCPNAESLRLDRVLRALPRIRRVVTDMAPDVAVPFMHSAYVPVAAALAGSGVPVLLSEHAPTRHFRDRPVQRLLVRTAEKLAVAKTVPSTGQLDDHPAAMRSRVYVMPNPVNVASFAAAANAPASSPPVLLGIGRFRAEKNFVELVRAFAAVAPRFPQWKLRLVGDGEERGRIEAELARLNLRERVILAGMTRDPVAEYAAASIVAIPSHYESFGLIAGEALAAGRPVISFDHCIGVAEIVDHGRNGLLVRGGTDAETRVGALEKGLARLMSDPVLRSTLGRAGPASVECYRPDRVLDLWEALLQGVITGQTGAMAHRAGIEAGDPAR